MVIIDQNIIPNHVSVKIKHMLITNQTIIPTILILWKSMDQPESAHPHCDVISWLKWKQRSASAELIIVSN
jgi:hypothetical protein